MRRDLVVASVAILAAIAGALVGGFATYLGTRSVEEARTDAAARGVARVLQTQLSHVDIGLRVMLENDQLARREEAYTIDLPIEEEQLLAANVSADAWVSVVNGLGTLELFLGLDSLPFKRAELGTPVPLGPDLEFAVRNTHRAVMGAEDALTSLSGITPLREQIG